MICVYDRMDTRFEGHGLGVLHPSKCEISEEAGGTYELTMEHPILESGEAFLLVSGAVIRAPGAPKREAEQEQLFRVVRVEYAEDGESVTVQARHISYDLMYNSIGSVVHEEKVPAGEIATELMAALENQEHGFVLDADGLNAPVAGSWEMCNGVNALLDQEAGLVRLARARLIRDNHRLLLLPEGAPESGVVIRYGLNMTGLQIQEDEEGVYTRFIPVGSAADGKDLFLPERHIDSSRIAQYPSPRIMMWRVTGAKVGGKVSGGDGTLTEEDVYGLLREAVQEKLDGQIDQPKKELQAGYIDLGTTEEYAEYGVLQTVCLYDAIGIQHELHGIALDIAVCGYIWDVLAGRYTLLKLGDVYADKTANVVVTAPQLAQQRRESKGQLLAANDRLDIVADEIYVHGQYIQLLATKEEVASQGSRLSEVEISLNAEKARIDLKADRTEVSADMSALRSSVSLALDAANARIDLKAERDEMIAGLTAVRNEVSIQIDAINARIDLEASHRDELLGEVLAVEISLDAINGRIELKADKTMVDALGTRISNAQLDIDAAKASITAQAQQLNAQGDRISGALLRLDGLEGEIELKVDKDGIVNAINLSSEGVVISAKKINLSGYVTISELEAEIARIDKIFSGSISYGSLVGGPIYATFLQADKGISVYGSPAEWKEKSVMTALPSLTANTFHMTYKDANGINQVVDVVTSVTFNRGTLGTIEYLGR